MKTATKTVKKTGTKAAAKPATKPAEPPAARKAPTQPAAKPAKQAAKPGPKAGPKAEPKAEPKKARKMGALDAAAIVLADAGKPMRSKELIAEMAKRGLWTSPGGKTPEATLYAAILREIGAKGTAARFARAGKGEFASTKKGGA